MLAYGIGRWLAPSSKDIQVPHDVYQAIIKSGKSDNVVKKSLKAVDRHAYWSVFCKRWAIAIGCGELFLVGAAVYFMVSGQYYFTVGETLGSVFLMIIALAIPVAGMLVAKKKYTDEIEKYIGTPEERVAAAIEWAQTLKEQLGNEKRETERKNNGSKDSDENSNDEKIIRIKATSRKPTRNETKYLCDSCDAKIEDGMKFCPNCGKKLDWPKK